jgi:hypothetical protein
MKNILLTIILTTSISAFCLANENNIVILEQYNNKTYSEMLKELGPPSDKTGYTIKNAPTKGWNHHELFSKYPKIPKNNNIQIMEVVWDMDTYVIFACYHIVDGENHCIVAKKMEKNIKF